MFVTNIVTRCRLGIHKASHFGVLAHWGQVGGMLLCLPKSAYSWATRTIDCDTAFKHSLLRLFVRLRKVNWHSIIGRCHVNCFMSGVDDVIIGFVSITCTAAGCKVLESRGLQLVSFSNVERLLD